MAFKDEIFPKQISFGSSGGPAFEVDVVTSGSGIEWRNQITELGRWEFEVSHAAQQPAAWKPLQKFFINMGAQAYSFRYYDFLDHDVLSGEGDFAMIDSTHFQMRKKYVFGSQTYVRTITKPISGTVAFTGGTVLSTDYATGIVTMTSGTPTAWTGQFHVHARFNVGQMRAETRDRQANGDYLVTWAPIPVVEIKAAT